MSVDDAFYLLLYLCIVGAAIQGLIWIVRVFIRGLLH